MRKILAWTIVALILAACGQPTQTPQVEIPERTATFAEIENDVQACQTETESFTPASLGDQFGIGGKARSGEDSRARLDLSPDATIVRLGPKTNFTLASLSYDSSDPFTLLELEAGKLFIILTDGQLDVHTDMGTASVRGSFMSVAYDVLLGIMSVTCLEGTCSLFNDAGTSELTSGQASKITAPGEAPSQPSPMDSKELYEWLQISPEAQELENLPQIKPPTPENLVFTITNNCSKSYRWVFLGAEAHEYVTAAGQTIQGELPPGAYTLLQIVEDGSSSPQEIKIEANTIEYNITLCSTQ